MPWDNSRAPNEGLSQWKAMTSCLLLPSHFCFPLWKCSHSLSVWRLACGSPGRQIPNCNSQLLPNKPMFVGEIPDQHFCSLWQYMLFKIQHTFILLPLSANKPHQTFRFEVNHVSEKMHTMGHLCAVLFKRARVWRRECSKECSGNWVECKVHKELKMRFVWKDGLWRIWVTARFIGCGCTRELRKH